MFLVVEFEETIISRTQFLWNGVVGLLRAQWPEICTEDHDVEVDYWCRGREVRQYLHLPGTEEKRKKPKHTRVTDVVSSLSLLETLGQISTQAHIYHRLSAERQRRH